MLHILGIENNQAKCFCKEMCSGILNLKRCKYMTQQHPSGFYADEKYEKCKSI